jgi:hypothetical protein
MRQYLKLSAAIIVGVLLVATMARVSGLLLVPFALALLLGTGYVIVEIVTGPASPHPRMAAGTFERTESAPVRLSEDTPCSSCTDWKGSGERRTTYRELVFLGVPLVRLSTTEAVFCDLCADPLATVESRTDAIDRELER